MKAIKNNFGLVVVCVAMLATALLIIQTRQAFGNITEEQPAKVGKYQLYTFFASSTSQTNFATTTNATSTAITQWTDSNGQIDKGFFPIAGAKRVSFFFKRGDTTGQGNSGSTNYRVQVSPTCSPSESDWLYYNKLVQNSATSTDLTTLSSVTISAATSTTVASMQLENDTFCAARVTVVETTDGEHSVKASADF